MATSVACQIVRWVDAEPFPGLVEVGLTDADGRTWKFVDKQSIFTAAALASVTPLPVEGSIRCEVIGRRILARGRALVVIDTSRPDGVESNGTTLFEVAEETLSA